MITNFKIFEKLNEQLGTASNFNNTDVAMVATKFPDARLENGIIAYTHNGVNYALIKGHDIIELMKKDEDGNYIEADENFTDIQQFVDTNINENAGNSFVKINFNSHTKHNPSYDILEGHFYDGSYITYAIDINTKTESMEYYKGSNYSVGSTSRSYSRHYKPEQIPSKYYKFWLELKELYNTRYANSTN